MLVIVPFVEISPVFVIVHTTADAEFLMFKELGVSSVSISHGPALNKFDLTVIPRVLPPEVTDQFIYSGPAPKSVNIRLLPAKALS